MSKNKNPSKNPLICAVFKMETPYIIEWVAWHKLQGFDLMIADNGTTGNQTKLLKALEEIEEIIYVDVKDKTGDIQMDVYSILFHETVLRKYKYMGFLDADEFFEPLKGKISSGGELLQKRLSKPFVWAASYRWAHYGSKGLKISDMHRMVLERFPKRASSEYWLNQEVKSFARVSALRLKVRIRGVKKVLWSPHIFKLWRIVYCLDGQRSKIIDEKAQPQDWNEARIRHYPLKSREEWEFKQATRGDVKDRVIGGDYWEIRDKNDISDPLSPEVLQQVKGKKASIESRLQSIGYDLNEQYTF